MNPLLKQSQSNKEESSTMNEQEQKLKEKYGKLPMKKNMLSGMKERKYFDSGDYAMQKAGVAAPDSVGSVGAGQGLRGMEGLERATPERLPHAQPPSLSSSPTNSTILTPPTAMPTSLGLASPPPTGNASRGLPIPGGNASQINHSSNATIPIARESSHSPSSSSSIPATVNTSGGHSPGSRPNAGSLSPSGGLSPSTSFGAGVAAGQGHSFSAKREGSGAVAAATGKIGLPGNAGVGPETNRTSPPAVSHSPLMSSGSVPPSSFPINHHLAASQSNNPASPSNLRDQNPLVEGTERRSSLSANSPVKPSNLSLGLKRQEESAMED